MSNVEKFLVVGCVAVVGLVAVKYGASALVAISNNNYNLQKQQLEASQTAGYINAGTSVLSGILGSLKT